MLAIKTKLGSSDNNLRSYAAARGLTEPDSMAEFDSWLNDGGGGGATCECVTIYNEGGTTGNYTITNCNGTEQSPNLIAGASRNHCIQAGSSVTINSGLLTEVYCGTSCNVAGDCTTC